MISFIRLLLIFLGGIDRADRAMIADKADIRDKADTEQM
jgi:hypothetical protein